jgi:PAS domain S-box-containing protein
LFFPLLINHEPVHAVAAASSSLAISPDSANGSVVSPEQSLDGILAGDNSGVAQAQHIITQHAATAASANSGGQQQQQSRPQMVYASSAPAPGGAAHPPQVAAQGINVPTPIPQYDAQSPAPGSPMIALTGITMAAHQQHGMVVTKRQRTGDLLAPVLADPTAIAAALQGRGRKKSQAQVDRRRERNRILARRTRLRKKFFFESLQKEVMDLQRENRALKDIVRSQLNDEEGQKLLSECDANQKLPPVVLEACGESADMDSQDFNLVKSIQQSQHCFVITDPSLEDNPIVFASDDFLSLTGYAREDVLGRNCRFLQGTETSREKVDQIRKGLSVGDDVSVTMVNYTADGTPFWNKLFIAALRDAQNNIVNFIGVTVKVAAPEPGDSEFGKKLAGEEFDPMDDDENDDDLDHDVVDDTVKAIVGDVEAAVAAAPTLGA